MSENASDAECLLNRVRRNLVYGLRHAISLPFAAVWMLGLAAGWVFRRVSPGEAER